MPGTARLLPDDQLAMVERLLAAKYRIGFPAVRALNGVRRFFRRRRERPANVGIEITLGA